MSADLAPIDDAIPNLAERLYADPEADLFDTFLGWTADRGLELYPAQEEAILEIFANNHVVLNTPTGSGKSLVGLAMHFLSFARGERSYYTSPIKALVSEKFFALCEHFGAENVGMMTGDASINGEAPIVCCTQEILAATALREGESADIQHAVVDEFHYYADRERGTAWQLPLLLMPQTVFLLMSATLGDTTRMRKELEDRTGRTVALVRSTERPVPLSFSYSKEKIVHLVAELIEKGRAPVYVVNFTQRECAELAQALTSVNYASDEEKAALKEALSTTKFETPYGKTVKKYLRHGIAIHHGGLLPKYRFLAEKLAQQGLLKVIVGTDTLGVGINMPLRTVVFTKLCKYDGRKVRLLTVRDFKQIAGRAGRRGFDTEGLVIAQAPEHVIENEIAQQKAAGNAKKLKKLRLKGPPDRGYVHWDDEIFQRLHTSDSEALESRFDIDHSTLLYLLQRPEGAEHGYRDLLRLIELSHEEPGRKSLLRRQARTLFQGLRHAGVVDTAPRGEEKRGQKIVLSGELQHDFSVHHSLSLFLVEILRDLDPELDSFPYTVLSFVEAILEDPGVVLRRQQDKARDREYARLKAEGAEYDELREKLDKVSWPKPDAEIIEQTFEVFADHHPWVRRFEPRPKSVAREMFERWATFNEYVNEYGLERSEGVLLRYLTQAYKAMRQNIPEPLKTDRIHEVIAYLREIIARADSSLVREWEAMRDGTLVAEADEAPPALDEDMPAFRARVHAELMQIVYAISQKDWGEAAALLRRGEIVWGPMDLEDEMEPFFKSYGELIFNHAARARSLFQLDRIHFGVYRVRQTLLDPEEDNMWYLEGKVDLADVRPEEGRLFALESIGDR